MMPLLKGSLLFAWILVLTACIGGARTISQIDDAEKLSELPAAYLPPHKNVSASSLETVVESYRSALKLVNKASEREHIARRLAVLELRSAENKQIDQSDANPELLYSDVISTYKSLLKAQQQNENNDALLYPLAKSYELSGNMGAALQTFSRLVTGYKQSKYYSEAQFRRGEILFAEQNYSAAASAYRAVVERKEATPFLLNARYMMGWSEFKLGRYDTALLTFSQVLDEQTVSHYTIVSDKGGEREDSSKAVLLDDVFRVMALSFSYRSGAESIATLLNSIGEKNYAQKLYKDLGDLYLDKKRYRDSAEVYSQYVERYSDLESAPYFKQQQIDAFAAGQFPDDVREQKRQFAKSYAILGDYWLLTTDSSRAFIKQKLALYIHELASYHHAAAQKNKKVEGKAVGLSSLQHYQRAEKWYEEWIRSFPDATDLASKWFLLAETRFEINDYKGAIAAYEITAYQFVAQPNVAQPNIGALSNMQQSMVDKKNVGKKKADKKTDKAVVFEQHNQAGYAAWLSYDHVIAPMELSQDIEGLNIWQQKKLASALRFINTFTQDSRKHSVMAQSVREFLTLNEYQQTINLSDRLIAEENVLEPLQLTAWLSSAHALKALEAHPAAELRYASALKLLSKNTNSKLYHKHYQATLDNYAASIYRQGEILSANGNTLAAANSFLRIGLLAASSTIAATASHDAGVLFMQAQSWTAAIDAMQVFQQHFPNHSQAKNIPSRLLQAKQASGDLSGAALQAIIIAEHDTDGDVRRQALYTAAELFNQSGDQANAIDRFRQYAHQYPQPLAERMEAMMHLSSLYADSKQLAKRQFWLKKMIATHTKAQVKTDRSTYLAAFSSAELAEEYLQHYYAVSLTHPLKASLAKKQKVISTAIDKYQRAANYALAEFSTLATHRMGEIYANFAQALLNSEKPTGLSELELEQYNFLLEEQAYPFEEQAIDLFTANVERSWGGIQSDAVKQSYRALAELLPARFAKKEIYPAR